MSKAHCLTCGSDFDGLPNEITDSIKQTRCIFCNSYFPGICGKCKGLKAKLAKAKAALEEIVANDYRGNAPGWYSIARAALKEIE